MNSMRSLVGDFVSLLYPDLCHGCSAPLVSGEYKICTRCHLDIPESLRKEDVDQMKLKFEGLVSVRSCFSLMKFHKSGMAQQLVHNIKYRGDRELARVLGRILGQKISQQQQNLPDAIVPVPLHEKKQRSRGFNQSRMIAEGIGEVLGVSVGDYLKRTRNSSTQTRKSKTHRWENTKDLFVITEGQFAAFGHILLVDDTLTTGATVAAAAQALSTSSPCRIDVAVLALAQ